MKNIRWQIVIGLILISLSALLYSLHYVIYKDAHHIFLYLLGDIAFLPIEVLLVTLIIHRFLQQREKDILMQKMNMVIGTFFSEVGNKLLEHFLGFNSHALRGNRHMIVSAEWSDKDFDEAVKFISGHQSHVDIHKGNLNELKDFLQDRRLFLLRLLENQNLLEHDSFTDLLWAVFHLSEELDARQDLSQLTEKDGKHLELDINRAYNHLLFEWLMYMKHMKKSYPYLFSLAVRTNIFRDDPSPEVK
ncbi:MAG: hypothetical protein Q7U10_07095 [Thermodesulfovibrionia bacterium]|nr:hypothetical protein [Thermodesulfovibrionia bacterium]